MERIWLQRVGRPQRATQTAIARGVPDIVDTRGSAGHDVSFMAEFIPERLPDYQPLLDLGNYDRIPT